jgi:cytochrome P450
VRINLGLRPLVGISDQKLINEILRDRPNGYRRWIEQRAVIEEMGPPGLFIVEGDDWKRQRRLVVTALNTNHIHRYFEIIRLSTERLHRRLQEAAKQGRVLDICDELTSYTRSSARSAVSLLASFSSARGSSARPLDEADAPRDRRVHRASA